MSLVQPPVPERHPSPSIELGTNNPFRTRLSGVPLSPASATDRFSYASSGSNGRPQSRNPFLDVFDDDNDAVEQPRSTHKASSFDSSTLLRPNLSGSAVELFDNLTITDHSGSSQMKSTLEDRGQMKPPPPPSQNRRPPPPPAAEGELISLDSDAPPPPYSDPRRRERDARGSSNADRPREPRRRPRRNSDSSVMDAHDAENREKSRRDRDRRHHRDHKSRGENGSSSSRSRREGRDKSSDRRKKHPALDVIDKLDVTGIYGSGLFHHDGPFDACNPHRNKSTRRLAPVQAYPADSANMTMTGFGPVNQKADHSALFGNRDPEAFNDYSTNKGPNVVRPVGARAISFDPKTSAEPVHGDESLGLGTSTFLDGAPASRNAVQRTMSDMDDRPRSSSDGAMGGGGLQRKKSLAQKIRAISTNKGGPGFVSDAPITSRRRAPPPPGGQRSPSEGTYSPSTPNESNPFFNDYSEAYDKKGESITVVRKNSDPKSPKKPPKVERVNSDKMSNENGLLKRVRSLSKPKQRRNE